MLVCLTLVFAASAGVASCVDGATPDCSDAATQCGPTLDGALDQRDVSQTLPEAAADASAESNTGTPDADAGDEI